MSRFGSILGPGKKRGATALAEDKEAEVERLKRKNDELIWLLDYMRKNYTSHGKGPLSALYSFCWS